MKQFWTNLESYLVATMILLSMGVTIATVASCTDNTLHLIEFYSQTNYSRLHLIFEKLSTAGAYLRNTGLLYNIARWLLVIGKAKLHKRDNDHHQSTFSAIKL